MSNNGLKGRSVPPLPTFTFSTGITVSLRRVSPFLLHAVQQQFPAPKPPVIDVEYGDGKTRHEANEADPDYQDKLAEHQAMLNDKLNDLMLEGGIVVDFDANELEEAKRVVATIGAAFPEEASDKLAYIKYVCIGNGDDITNVIRAIQGQSFPTEANVQQYVETFPGNV